MPKSDILDIITPDQALIVLKQLAVQDPKIKKKAREIALGLVDEVDVEGVTEEVFWALDSIALEDVWDRSGSKRDGYVDPGDAAWEVFEEALDPFLDSLRKCHKLGLTLQAKRHCMGILKGICRFEKESKSEFKSWAADAPGEYFVSTYQEWRKGNADKQDIAEMKRFVKTFCPTKANFCK
jgi:hypothetical protein